MRNIPFLRRELKAVQVRIGITDNINTEVLSGLNEGDQVVTGPYNSVRNIADGDPVKVDNSKQNSSSNR